MEKNEKKLGQYIDGVLIAHPSEYTSLRLNPKRFFKNYFKFYFVVIFCIFVHEETTRGGGIIN